MRLLLRLFSSNWKTWLFWGLFLGLVHLFGCYSNIDFLTKGVPWIHKLVDFGDQQFIATITEVYAGLYGLGVPLLLTLFENSLKEFKTGSEARDFIVFNSDVLFFVSVTPLFIIYSISILYVGECNDLHVLILYFLVCLSIYKLYRLVDFSMAVLHDFPGLLNNHSKKRIHEVLKKNR